MTSLSQCTSSSTRLAATATAIPAATPASAARVARAALAAEDERGGGQNAAASEEWPLGNDGPSVAAIGLSVGPRAVDQVLDRRGEQPVAGDTTSMNGDDPAVARPASSRRRATRTASTRSTTGSPEVVTRFSTVRR